MTKIKGIAADNISINAGAAAWAKSASEEALQTSVANVSKPKGLKIKVAGNSFMVSRNTSAPPANIPGLIKGRVIERITENASLPRLRPAYSKPGCTCNNDGM